MSRLDSFIRRMTAQRDILNAVLNLSLLPDKGDIFELGLGNGRTFSHLRELFPQRRVIVFDRVMQAHSSSIPEPENLIIGEISELGKQFAGHDAAMVHADIGSGSDEVDAVTLQWLPDLTASMLASQGIAVCGLPLDHPLLSPLPLPSGIDSNRYFLYRKSK
ncbi:MAG: class I SAM-dependent methyltransferase [Granulosicoccus sp.]|nr:class I SAM-dependent methyltransferase [Granulosicoccus sp.]